MPKLAQAPPTGIASCPAILAAMVCTVGITADGVVFSPFFVRVAGFLLGTEVGQAVVDMLKGSPVAYDICVPEVGVSR